MSNPHEIRTPHHAGERAWATPFSLSVITLALLLVVFGWQTILLLANVYEGSEDYSHGFVVPLVSLYAAWEIRKKYRDETYLPSWWGLPVVLAGALLLLVGHWYRYALLPGGLGVQSMVGLGLLIVIFGLALSLGGTALVTRFAFPLCYLCFCVPLPDSLANQITVPLRSVVSDCATVIVRMFGVPIYQEGNMLYLATTSLGVADACSGIRSLWIMLATAVAFGYFLRCGLARTLTLFVLAVPLAVFFNIVRVVATALLVIWRGPHYAQGLRHELTGAVVFLAGVLTLVAIGWILAWGRHKAAAKESPEPRAGTAGASAPWQLPQYLLVGAVGLVLVVGGVIQPVMAKHYVRHMPLAARKPFKELPNRIGSYTETGKGDFVAAQLDLLKPTDTLNRTYRSERGTLVNLWTLYWEPYRGKKSAWNLNPHKPDGCYPAAGWEQVQGGPTVLKGLIPGRDIQIRLFRKERTSRLIFYVTSGVENPGGLTSFPGTAAGRFRQMVDSWRAPDVVLGEQYIVTVETDVASDPGKAVAEVTEFMKQLAPLLPQFGIRG